MSDMKSKMPDLKELAAMTGKLFNDIKTSVSEIIQDYKEVRAKSDADVNAAEEVPPKAASKAKTAEKPKE